MNRVKKCFFFVSFSPSLLHLTTKELAGIENHHGGKQSSPKPKEINFLFPLLDDSQLGGGNVQSIDVGRETGESLLGAVGAVNEKLAIAFSERTIMSDTIRARSPKGIIPDEGVDLDGVNVVQLLQSLLDLALVGLDVDDEDEGVVLLDLLHGTLGVEGVQDDVVGIHAGFTGDRDTGVLGGPRELQGLGAVEGGRGADLAGLVELEKTRYVSDVVLYTRN